MDRYPRYGTSRRMTFYQILLKFGDIPLVVLLIDQIRFDLRLLTFTWDRTENSYPLLSRAIFAAATIWSPGASFITLTPWVFLPMTEMPFAGVLIMMPFLLMNMRSSSSVTDFMATTLPLRSLQIMFLTPRPPLFVSRYIETAVRLPYPFSVAVKRDLVSSATTMPITSSSLKDMPLTPVALRPMALTLFSSNRSALPSFVAMMTCWLPSVNAAWISSSFSLRVTAMMPALRGLLKSLRFTFFMTPFLVTMIM